MELSDFIADSAQNGLERGVIRARENGKAVSARGMRYIYEQVKTPYKYGIVLRDPSGLEVDCPAVFRHDNQWYMVYVCMNRIGYETHLAQSDNLLEWTPLGKILPFRRGEWDACQASGYPALQDHNLGGSYELRTYDGKYWMSYMGGAMKGYETDPLAIGIAWTTDPAKPRQWERLESAVLSRDQAHCRYWEKLTQYKSNIICDSSESLGWPFVMFYNAKTTSGYECIGMAVSRDMGTWNRYGEEPVIDNGKGISGDPQVVRIDDIWVMFYFGAFYEPKAFDTFACSSDLVRWTRWSGPHLVEPSTPWDRKYAHKPWVIKHDNVVYHFYCAVGDQGRVIALATSKKL